MSDLHEDLKRVQSTNSYYKEKIDQLEANQEKGGGSIASGGLLEKIELLESRFTEKFKQLTASSLEVAAEIDKIQD